MRDKIVASSALGCAALLAVAFGWYQMFRFSATPGEQQSGPSSWPQTEPRPGNGRSPLLLVFVHPGCSCTHATLEQLDRLLGATNTPVDVVLEVYQSRVLLDRGYVTDLRPWFHRRATVAPDMNGRLAGLFHVRTSGEILLYTRQGNLLFQGGITPERAQLGSSAGEALLRHALLTGLPEKSNSAVFGCPLFHLLLPG